MPSFILILCIFLLLHLRWQLSPRLTAMNVGVPTCVTKQRSRDTARSSVWVIIFFINNLPTPTFWGVRHAFLPHVQTGTHDELPRTSAWEATSNYVGHWTVKSVFRFYFSALSALSVSVFWGVSNTEVVLFFLNCSTRKNLRPSCVCVAFVISSSRCERRKLLVSLLSWQMRYINEGIKVKVLDKYVESGPEMKLLGVTFNEHLKFTSHLDEASKRVCRKIGVMMRLKNLIPILAKL